MPRDFPRSRRIEDQIQRVLSDVFRSDLRDPRLNDLFITAVRVSKDLSVAWVYYSVVQTDTDIKAVDEGLAKALGFLRSRLAKVLTIRRVPELRFEFDATLRQAGVMDDLIGKAVSDDRERHHDDEDVPDDDEHG